MEMHSSSLDIENGIVMDVCREEVDKTSVLSLREFLRIRICWSCSARSPERTPSSSFENLLGSSMSAQARASKHRL